MTATGLRVLRIYPGANDPRHRKRDLALQRAGVEVGLVLPHQYGADQMVAPVEAQLPHWRARLVNSGSIPGHIWSPRALSRAVVKFQPDLIDVHEEPFFPAGAQAVWAARGRPVAMYTAQNLAKSLPAPVMAMQRWVFSKTAAIYGTSEGAVEVVRARGFAGVTRVIPIGVDAELFGVVAVGQRIGFIGRLVPEKGVGDILQFGDRLLCIGDGPMRTAVEAVGGEVRRAVSLAELAASLAQMGVLVAPSLSTPGWKEQFGRMVVEAMAAGVPVVAYASGSLPEVIGDAGLLVPEGDSETLGAAVEAALEDRTRLGKAGRERARRLFTWDAVAARMIAMYEAIR